MAPRRPLPRYAALLTLLLIAGAAGRTLREGEEASPSPEWVESPAEEEWAESPPPESPEPEPSSDGSSAATADAYPFVTAVMKGDAPLCSGALIAPSAVLTSAHCVVRSDNSTEEVWVRLGWPDLKASTAVEGAEERGVSQVIAHPSWFANQHPAKGSTDLALLVLDSPSEIKPIKLPAKGLKVEPDTPVWNAGYSVSSAGGTETLARVDLKTLNREECRQTFDSFWELFYKATDTILDLQMCTTGEVEGQATCRGDSGGPLVLGEGEDATLIGVLAWGTSGSCDSPKPDSVDFWSSLLNTGNRQWVDDELSSLGASSVSSDGGAAGDGSAPEDGSSSDGAQTGSDTGSDTGTDGSEDGSTDGSEDSSTDNSSDASTDTGGDGSGDSENQ